LTLSEDGVASLDETMVDESQQYRTKGSPEGMRALLVGSGTISVITERDLSKAIAHSASPDTPISQFAHRLDGISMVDDSTSLMEAARLMLTEPSATFDPDNIQADEALPETISVLTGAPSKAAPVDGPGEDLTVDRTLCPDARAAIDACRHSPTRRLSYAAN
jgi:hypothetical protein